MWLPDDAVAAAEAAVALGHSVEARGVKFKTWQKGTQQSNSYVLVNVEGFIRMCTLYQFRC